MKFAKLNLTLVILIFLLGCRQSHKGMNSIELGFQIDTSEKAECFSDFYKSKINNPNTDSLLNRFIFPFTYVTIIKGTDDWQSLKFINLKELTSSDKFKSLIASLHQQIKFDRRFDKIFAPNEQPEFSLKVSAINENDRFMYVHFVTNSGQWFIKSFQEVPVFEDGGIPVEDE